MKIEGAVPAMISEYPLNVSSVTVPKCCKCEVRILFITFSSDVTDHHTYGGMYDIIFIFYVSVLWGYYVITLWFDYVWVPYWHFSFNYTSECEHSLKTGNSQNKRKMQKKPRHSDINNVLSSLWFSMVSSWIELSRCWMFYVLLYETMFSWGYSITCFCPKFGLKY